MYQCDWCKESFSAAEWHSASIKVERVEGDTGDYGVSQKATSLYLKQIPSEKRELLNLVYSNSTFGSGELRPNL